MTRRSKALVETVNKGEGATDLAETKTTLVTRRSKALVETVNKGEGATDLAETKTTLVTRLEGDGEKRQGRWCKDLAEPKTTLVTRRNKALVETVNIDKGDGANI